MQVGDPFMEKLLIEACLEIYDADLVVGIQDLGGAGLTCALTETAAGGRHRHARLTSSGCRCARPSMAPHEILASESQERMLLIVTPENLDAVLAIAEKWGVLATAIGEVTAADGRPPGRLVITWHGELVVDVPPGSLADDGPVYARPMREPADLILLQADRAETLPRPAHRRRAAGDACCAWSRRPNLCDKTLGHRAVRPVRAGQHRAGPAGGRRRDPDRRARPASASRCRSTATAATPGSTRTQGAKLALAEAYRNVAVTGADADRGHQLPQLRLARGPGA